MERHMKIPVFMYHALYQSKEALVEADPFYAISFDTFREHLDLCKELNRPALSVLKIIEKNLYETSGNYSVFTFDDGHISNLEAAKILYEYGFSADFFINTDNIGCEGYLGKTDLILMADMGMSIQSHSHEHKYITDLSLEGVRFQLTESKRILESIISKRVEVFAPPGGRINSKVEKIAADTGYKVIANSRPGLWDTDDSMMNIPRFAILNSTTTSLFHAWLLGHKWSVYKVVTKYKLTKIIKKSLGNNRYDRLRKFIIE